MKLERLVARGFRNLGDLDRDLPSGGVALLGANGQGKTNLLEALYYPVLFRSFRGVPDQEVARFGGPGFHVEVWPARGSGSPSLSATYHSANRKKRIALDDEEVTRLADGVGRWVSVVFLPEDVGLAGGSAAVRRRYLDRMLSLAARDYLGALGRYRAALAQRNGALRQGRPDVARAFDRVLAEAGAVIIARRVAWVEQAAAWFSAELDALGECASVRLRYAGRAELADPAAWPAALDAVFPRDRSRGMTTIGPQRDDLLLELDGRPLGTVGSTGQWRTAAIALKLLEIATLAEARACQPALLLDDVFAELDRERQRRLARRLTQNGGRQIFVTAPRYDELPEGLDLTVWEVRNGVVRG